MCNCICINKGGHLKSNLQLNGIWTAAAWPPLHLCYHTAVFFRHFRMIALSHPQAKIRNNFQQFYLLKGTLKLRKPGSVCTVVHLGICLEKRRKLKEASVNLAAIKTNFLRFGRCGSLLGYGMWKIKYNVAIISSILQLNAHVQYYICVVLFSKYLHFFHSRTVHLGTIKNFYLPTDAQ